MKKVLLISSALFIGGISFADDENYDGQLLTGDFSRKSMVNSSWRNATTGSERLSFIYSDLTNAVFDGAVMNAWFGTVTFNGASFRYADLSKKTKDGTGFDGAKVINVDFTGANLSDVNFQNADVSGSNFTDAIINGANFGENIAVKNFTVEQLCSTKSYKIKDLSRVNFCKVFLDGCDFSGQNLQHASFYRGSLKNTDFTGADIRGTLGADVDFEGKKTKNTIGQTGEIKNFSMESVDDSLTIRKYVPATSGGAMINAKIVDDASISGGAVLTLEQGAVLEIASGKTLSVLDDSEIIFNVDAATDATKILLGENSKLVFGSDSKITINLDGVASSDDSYTFSVIESAAGAQVMGTDSLKKENVILNVNGETFDSSKWTLDFDSSTGSFNINVNVPEPAEWAAILGAIAIAFGMLQHARRRGGCRPQ